MSHRNPWDTLTRNQRSWDNGNSHLRYWSRNKFFHLALPTRQVPQGIIYGGMSVEQTEHDVAWGTDVDRHLVCICQGGRLKLCIYTISQGFGGQIFPWPLKFPSNDSLAGLWQFVFVEQPAIIIQQCFVFRWKKTRNLLVVHRRIVD